MNRLASDLTALDIAKLHHAYGPATDLTVRLGNLSSDDADAAKQSMIYLWSAILHQGTPWSATAPVARAVANWVTDPEIEMPHVRADLVAFLSRVVETPENTGLDVAEVNRMAAVDISAYLINEDLEALYEDEDAANSFYAHAILDCITVRPELMKALKVCLQDPAPRVRAWASAGLAHGASTDAGREDAAAIEASISDRAHCATERDEKCAHVLALGQLSTAALAFITDSDVAVRTCAALSRKTADNPQILAQLLTTLEQHSSDMDEWFTEKPPQIPMRLRYVVVARLLERVPDFSLLESAAVAVAKATNKASVDFDWGPLLAAAFAPNPGHIKTHSQRRYLQALVNRDDLWDPRFGNSHKWFKQAGLPYDREQCEGLIALSPDQTDR